MHRASTSWIWITSWNENSTIYITVDCGIRLSYDQYGQCSNRLSVLLLLSSTKFSLPGSTWSLPWGNDGSTTRIHEKIRGNSKKAQEEAHKPLMNKFDPNFVALNCCKLLNFVLLCCFFVVEFLFDIQVRKALCVPQNVHQIKMCPSKDNNQTGKFETTYA